MITSTIANRYAAALFEIGKSNHQLPQMKEDLKLIGTVFTTNPELLGFLEHPKVTKENKKASISEAFSSVLPAIKNTLCIAIDRNRQEIIPELASAFEALLHKENNEAEAIVYSVRPLSENEKQAVAETFAKRAGVNRLYIQNVIDDSLLGGIRVRIGNTVYDGSLSSKIQNMARELRANRA
ncbi:MAG: F0F1 ATP synthase subunit delta [Bacilli bacterium]